MSTPPGADTEAAMIERLGYQPVLDRVMGAVRATMVNISTSSVTTAIFTLFAYGLLTGGTAFVWTWAVGFGILLLVTLVFAELGSSMPLARRALSVGQPSRRPTLRLLRRLAVRRSSSRDRGRGVLRDRANSRRLSSTKS